MHDLYNEFRNTNLPAPADADMFELGLARWREGATALDNKQLSEVVENLTDDCDTKRILGAIFGNSPYLTQVCLNDPTFVLELLQHGPDETVVRIIDDVKALKTKENNATDLPTALRRTKQQLALSVALGDLSGLWSLDTVTHWLSEFAEQTLQAACTSVLRDGAQKGHFELAHEDDPQRDSGFIILAMGKLGARELNYSSDIDLIVLYDPEQIRTTEPQTLQKRFVRMTRELSRIMDERTAHGYVFRTDLRLRPDPGATPLAVTRQAAEVYYESQGQNWERAAMIKARAVAGDIAAGEDFLKWLTPFVWRKNLDFAAIQDIHSIKRQINAQRGGKQIAVEGHNIKLGRGGIREIEFFAQTQQLIWGGRQPDLRSCATVPTLNALVQCGHVQDEAAAQMISAYEFLRQSEHRLQMVNDEQTQTLPETSAEMQKLSIFMGFSDRDAFAHTLLGHLGNVEAHYGVLFQDAPALSAGGTVSGNLVFTGSDADPDTLETIAKFGFQQPETVDAAIRGWHHGRYRAMRSTRAREMLTELTPALLKALGDTPDPNATFLKFDEFLAGLPAGVQLFSMLHSNPQLLDLLAEIMGEAPRLAELLSRRPSLFDGVLSSDFLDPPPPLEQLIEHLNTQLARSEYFEDTLDICRRWTNDRKFQIGLQNLHGLLSAPKAAWALSDMAEATLNCMLPQVEDEFARSHGRIPGAQFCTIAFGKLGGHEMTPTSDLDLVFVYDIPDDASASDGDKPLSPTQYFARLGQRYINALTAPTAEGTLYEVDMRLRPSGNSGPLACTLDAFIQYHHETAWTWERMALSRARTLTGSDAFRAQVNNTIRDLLAQPHDPDSLRNDVANMRARMDAEHHTDELWSIKHLRGGLVDVEFLTQYLQLRHAASNPAVLSPNTWRALNNLQRAGCLADEDANILLRALDLWQGVQSRLHLSIETDAPKGGAGAMPVALQARFIKLGGASNLGGVEDVIRATADEAYGVFKRIVGEPVVDS